MGTHSVEDALWSAGHRCLLSTDVHKHVDNTPRRTIPTALPAYCQRASNASELSLSQPSRPRATLRAVVHISGDSHCARGARVSRETQGDMRAAGRSWSTSPASVGRLSGVGRMSGSLRSAVVHVMAGSPRPCRAPLLSEAATALLSAQSSERTGCQRRLLRQAQFLRRDGIVSRETPLSGEPSPSFFPGRL